MDFEKRFNDLLSVISPNISGILGRLSSEIKKNIYEIRIRIGCPVALSTNKGIMYLSKISQIESRPSSDCYIASKSDISESFRMVCGYSVYSFQNEIKNGYITVKGGHRIGIAGTAVIENDSVLTVKDISSLNYRVARQVQGIAKPIADRLFGMNKPICGAIIAGCPSSGKTTILRDLASLLSGGYLDRFVKVVVIDERGELGAVYLGKPENDMGICCDILNGYPKDEGIMIALRCLAPDLIICDEIGTSKEVEAVQAGANSGVPIITTVHADSKASLFSRPQIKALLATGAFTNIVMLEGKSSPGIVREFIKVSDFYDN